MIRRLANQKTKNQSGFDYTVGLLELLTPFGNIKKKEMEPFYKGMEEALSEELNKVQLFKESMTVKEEYFADFFEIMAHMKDCTGSIERAEKDVLSVVELFEIKSLVIAMEKLRIGTDGFKATFSKDFPACYRLKPVSDLLKILDPRNENMETFYIYDEFSEKLKALREKKREAERDLRRQKREKAEALRKEGIDLNPGFELTVSKQNSQEMEKLSKRDELFRKEEDYTCVVFSVKTDERMEELLSNIERIHMEIEEEEERVRESLSLEISLRKETLLSNVERIGNFDLVLAKAGLAVKKNLVRPDIVNSHKVKISKGRHLEVEEYLSKKGREFHPVDLDLKTGVTCITGANMGGKTVSLKLACLTCLLTQYGLFVPAQKAELGLCTYIQLLAGDTQSPERGLSSFGGEMEELREALDALKDYSFLLIDEVASGTNPQEGRAISKGLISYLAEKKVISLITTHFDTVTDVKGVKNLQVTGLENADFDELKRKLRYANRKERIELVASYMDYSLKEQKDKKNVPREAIKIAEILGIYPEIIDRAKGFLE